MNETVIVTARSILSATAACIIKQSPYPIEYNLMNILEDVRMHLISLGFRDEFECTDKSDITLYLHKTTDELFDICNSLKNIPSIDKLNITHVEEIHGITNSNDPNRSARFILTGKGISNKRDREFIDLDALIRNIYNLVLKILVES